MLQLCRIFQDKFIEHILCWLDRPGQHVGSSGLSLDRPTCFSDHPTYLSWGQWPICPGRTVRVDMSDRPGPARTVQPVPRTVRLIGPEVSGFYAPYRTVWPVRRTVRAKHEPSGMYSGPSDMVASPTLLSGLGVDLVGRPTRRSDVRPAGRTVRSWSGPSDLSVGPSDTPLATPKRLVFLALYISPHLLG